MASNVLRKGIRFLLIIGICYAGALFALTYEPIQKELIYLNKISFSRKAWLAEPERVGFATGQVAQYHLSTPDGETIHTWHIVQSWHSCEKPEELLAQPDAQIVIYFHGNAGTLIAGHRPDIYRSFLSASPKIQVIAIDYRGFGLSTGVPSEEGLIRDGITVVHWALSRGVKARNIAIVGQSLGSAVAIAVSERLALADVHVRLTMPIAGFSDIRTLLETYKLFQIIPILQPLRLYPMLQSRVSSFLQHKWESVRRIATLAGQCKTKISIVHTTKDREIPFTHADTLFQAAVQGAGKAYRPVRTQLGNEGFKETVGQIEKVILEFGTHNTLSKSSRIGMLIVEAFEEAAF